MAGPGDSSSLSARLHQKPPLLGLVVSHAPRGTRHRGSPRGSRQGLEQPPRSCSEETLLPPTGLLLLRPPRPPGAASCNDQPCPRGVASLRVSPDLLGRGRARGAPCRPETVRSAGDRPHAEMGVPWCPQKPAQDRGERRSHRNAGRPASSTADSARHCPLSASAQGGSRTDGRWSPRGWPWLSPAGKG